MNQESKRFSYSTLFCASHISPVLNEKGTGYEYLMSNESKNGANRLKQHPKMSKFTKFESFCFKPKGMAHC